MPHPPGIMEGLEGSCRCLGAHLAVQPVLCLEDPRTPTLGCRRRIRRRTSTEERTSRAQKRGIQVSCRALGWQTPPESRPQRASPPSSLASRACRVAAATDPASYWGRCCRRPGVRLRCSRTPASWAGDPHPALLHLLVPEMGNGARVEGAKGGPGEEGLRGRGGSRLSARGGAFSPGQSALGRRR